MERCLLLLAGQALVCEVASLQILFDEGGQFVQEVFALVDQMVKGGIDVVLVIAAIL